MLSRRYRLQFSAALIMSVATSVVTGCSSEGGSGLNSAVGVVQAPGEQRLLVVERTGVVRPSQRLLRHFVPRNDG